MIDKLDNAWQTMIQEITTGETETSYNLKHINRILNLDINPQQADHYNSPEDFEGHFPSQFGRDVWVKTKDGVIKLSISADKGGVTLDVSRKGVTLGYTDNASIYKEKSYNNINKALDLFKASIHFFTGFGL